MFEFILHLYFLWWNRIRLKIRNCDTTSRSWFFLTTWLFQLFIVFEHLAHWAQERLVIKPGVFVIAIWNRWLRFLDRTNAYRQICFQLCIQRLKDDLIGLRISLLGLFSEKIICFGWYLKVTCNALKSALPGQFGARCRNNLTGCENCRMTSEGVFWPKLLSSHNEPTTIPPRIQKL